MAMEETNLALNAHHDPMTDAQRDEIKHLCSVERRRYPISRENFSHAKEPRLSSMILRQKIDEHKSPART